LYRTSAPDAVFLTAMQVRRPLAGALVAALALPAGASAQQPPAMDQFKKRCYVSVSDTMREPVAVHATGFMPKAMIDVLVDDAKQPQQAQADATGQVTGFVLAPFWASGQRLFTVRLQEALHPLQAAAQTSKVTALAVTQSPATAETHDRVHFRGRGFTDATAAVYAHYVFRGKVRDTVRIAKPYGDCGLFSVRRRQFPFKKNPRRGVWTIQFDQLPVYNPSAPLFTTLKVTVRARPGGG
jgi:hypothetical protein